MPWPRVSTSPRDWRGCGLSDFVVAVIILASSCAALRSDVEQLGTSSSPALGPSLEDVPTSNSPSTVFNPSVLLGKEHESHNHQQTWSNGSLHSHGNSSSSLAEKYSLGSRADNEQSIFVQSCSCAALGPVLLVSHRGEFLQSDNQERLQMSPSNNGAGTQWNILSVGDGKFVLRNGLNLTLQEMPKVTRESRKVDENSLLSFRIDSPGLWEHWSILSDLTGGQDCSEVIITSHANRYLQDNRGIPLLSGNPGAWERWKLVSPNGRSPCGVSLMENAQEHSEEVHLQNCQIFYQTATGVDQAQSTLRNSTVQNMMRKYARIKRMKSIYYTRDWDVLTSMFKASRLPVSFSHKGTNWYTLAVTCHKCDIHEATKGQIAKWATLILGVAWQVRFQKPCMTLLEDDIMLPENFWARIATLAPNFGTREPSLLRFENFGEGYVFNLKAATMFLRRIYELGIDDDSDVWTNAEMKDHSRQVDVGISKLVLTGWGNIWKTPHAPKSDFNYSASHDSADLQILTGAFNPEDESARSIDLVATASRVANFKHLSTPSVL